MFTLKTNSAIIRIRVIWMTVTAIFEDTFANISSIVVTPATEFLSNWPFFFSDTNINAVSPIDCENIIVTMIPFLKKI